MSKDACSKKLFSIIQDVLHLQSSWIAHTKLINACAKLLERGCSFRVKSAGDPKVAQNL